MKENKKRIIFWGLIFVLCIVGAVLGKLKYDQGYGSTGPARIKLNTVSTEFNKLDGIIKLGTLKTKIDGEKLIIESTANSKKFEYTYSKVNNVEVITSTYPNNDTVANLIAVNLIDAVYKMNNGKGSVTEYYNIDTFKNTTVSDGVMINGDANVTITINLNSNVVANLADKIPTIKEGNSITEEELADMLDTLKSTKKFRLQKEDLIVYVKDINTSYEIYFQYSEEKDMFKSLANVVKILNPEIHKYMVDDNGVINIESGSPYYNIITNVNFTEPDIFERNNGIFETIISK